jgi:hypothetical protein
MSDNRHARLLRQYLEEVTSRPDDGRPTPWAEWLRVTLGAAVALGAALTLTGCGGTVDGRDEPDAGVCSNCTGGTGGAGDRGSAAA